jgi:hypothetical protein
VKKLRAFGCHKLAVDSLLSEGKLCFMELMRFNILGIQLGKLSAKQWGNKYFDFLLVQAT